MSHDSRVDVSDAIETVAWAYERGKAEGAENTQAAVSAARAEERTKARREALEAAIAALDKETKTLEGMLMKGVIPTSVGYDFQRELRAALNSLIQKEAQEGGAK